MRFNLKNNQAFRADDKDRKKLFRKSLYYTLPIVMLLLLAATVGTCFAGERQSDFDFQRAVDSLYLTETAELPIGELTAEIGKMFLGTPYKPGTLEGIPEGPCRYDFGGVDCVTFYEYSYALAAAVKRHYPRKPTFDDFCKEISLIRYKKTGYGDDSTYADTLLYSDRLHYSSEWIFYNLKRGLFRDVTPVSARKAFRPEVFFMSTHREKYPAPLAEDDAILNNIIKNEKFISEQTLFFVPEEDIAGIENELQNGDIVFITSAVEGLDYNHTGIIIVSEDSTRRIMHASSSKGIRKVIIGKRISEYVKSGKRHTGITVLRPTAIK